MGSFKPHLLAQGPRGVFDLLGLQVYRLRRVRMGVELLLRFGPFIRQLFDDGGGLLIRLEFVSTGIVVHDQALLTMQSFWNLMAAAEISLLTSLRRC